MNTPYERTISSLEAEQGYFLILKNQLRLFPKVGSTFSLTNGHMKQQAMIESYRCECQGPDKPHEHYFVRWAGLAKGDHLIVSRSLRDQQLFSISIEE
ncbi:MAG: hypothetical protein WCX28_11815 [Bacteriovoracaceae bacterium]|nr:hypothetical protein [Bacteroidota bacterium]